MAIDSEPVGKKMSEFSNGPSNVHFTVILNLV
jgi:hypothetical protein